jgi:hypothetical protein
MLDHFYSSGTRELRLIIPFGECDVNASSSIFEDIDEQSGNACADLSAGAKRADWNEA